MSTPPSSGAARLAPALGEPRRAAELTRRRETLRERFEERSGSRSSAPTRSRSTATSARCASSPPMPAMRCSPASPRRNARAGRRRRCCADVFSGWGIRTIARRRSALQPDVLPQRLDLAARQRADRPRSCALRLQGPGAACNGRLVRRRPELRAAAPARTVLRVSSPAPTPARPPIRSPARRKPGRRLPSSRCSRGFWASRSYRISSKSGFFARRFRPGCPKYVSPTCGWAKP